MRRIREKMRVSQLEIRILVRLAHLCTGTHDITDVDAQALESRNGIVLLMSGLDLGKMSSSFRAYIDRYEINGNKQPPSYIVSSRLKSETRTYIIVNIYHLRTRSCSNRR